MTDTARTLSALKALLADNTTGQISAQDVRDLVESVANPLYRGGFDHSNSWKVSGSFWGHLQDAPTVPNDAWTALDLTAFSAQAGGVNSGDGAIALGTQELFSGWFAKTLPANSWIEVSEPGWYFFTGGAYFAHDATGDRGLYIDYVDYPIADNDGYGDPQYTELSAGSALVPVSTLVTAGAGENVNTSGRFRVLASALPFRVAPVFRQTTSGPLGVTAVGFSIGRVS